MDYLIVAIRGLLPLLYCLIYGTAFAVIFKKRIIEALAPAFFATIIMMMISGILFQSVTIGAALTGVITVVVATIKVIRNKDFIHVITVHDVVVLLMVYFAIYVSNYGKYFASWDEFTHWGHFVKETIRLDALFCSSPLKFVHKDYVPAIPLFEALWCKLSLRYSEANAYRAIQMLQASMVLPVVVSNYESENKKRTLWRSLVISTLKMQSMFSVPLLFFALRVYHTIYVDMIFGFLIFYCMWIIVSSPINDYASVCFLTLGLSVLILSKMTALIFIPMIVCFYFVYSIKMGAREQKEGKSKIMAYNLFTSLCTIVIPFFLWIFFNKYASQFKTFEGGIQSYGALSFEHVRNIILHNGVITYQSYVDGIYLKALVIEPVVWFVPYIWALLICVFAILIWCKVVNKDLLVVRQARLIALWNGIAGMAYAYVMRCLYLTTFSEEEARKLAAYSRYMSSFILAIMLLDLSFILYHSIDSLWRLTIVFACIFVFGISSSFYYKTIDQVFPGNIGRENGLVTKDEEAYEWEVFNLRNKVPEDSTLYVVSVGATNGAVVCFSYSLSPMQVWGSSLDLINYAAMTQEEFTQMISDKDYIYVRVLKDGDEDFVARYAGYFADSSVLYRGAIIKIDDVSNGIINCHVIDEISLGEG